MKLWQVILYPIFVMLIVLGCVTVYQRETSIIQNQALLASEIVTLKAERDQVNKQIEQYLNGLNARLMGLENKQPVSEKKK